MKLLILTHSYAPQVTPRAFRWSAIAEYWAEQGHHVDVVCGWRAGDARDECLRGVFVHRPGGRVIESLRQHLRTSGPRRTEVDPQRAGRAGVPWRSGLSRLAHRVHDSTWKQVYWPDYACTWFAAARRKARALLQAERHDGLITVSHPFTPHLVGAALRARGVAWLADVGDPFAFLRGGRPNNRLYTPLNYAVERRVLAAAGRVAVTTELTRATYIEHFPELARKVFVIPPVLSLPPAKECPSGFFPEDDRIRLVFTGTLYRGVRSPEPLLRLFRRLLATRVGSRLELHFIGDANGCEDYFRDVSDLQGRQVFTHGPLPREQTARAMYDANVLVNLGNGTREQLPSKVVEYIATGRRVLNVAATAGDSSSDFFRDYSAAFLLSREDLEAGNRLDELVRFIEAAPSARPTEVADRVRPYRVDSIAAAYERLLQADRDENAGSMNRHDTRRVAS